MAMIKWVFSVCVLFFLLSCSTQKDGRIFHAIEPDDVEFGIIEDSLLTIEVAYIGAVGHSYIFECAITNHSNESLIIDKSQFAMHYNEDMLAHAWEEDLVVQQLKEDQKSLKKRRKASAILGAVGIGLAAIVGAAEGISAGENILYSAEPLIYIFDERRWYNRNIETIEDEIEYIRSAQYNSLQLLPDITEVRDLLFPTKRVKTDVDIVFIYDSEEYVVTFPKNIFR